MNYNPSFCEVLLIHRKYMQFIISHLKKCTLSSFSSFFFPFFFIPTHSTYKGAAFSSLVAQWAAVWRVEQLILHWGNVSSQIHLISPGCPGPSSALTVQKSGLKHCFSIHPSTLLRRATWLSAWLHSHSHRILGGIISAEGIAIHPQFTPVHNTERYK